MTVRLGFAIAAHLEPEILVVDEVLAVGDAEFQKKAIGKMQDVSKGEGRTVLFVSHNMGTIKSLCTSGLLLENGAIQFSGSAQDTVNKYLSGSSIDTDSIIDTIVHRNRMKGMKSVIQRVELLNKFGSHTNTFCQDDDIYIRVTYDATKETELAGCGYIIYTEDEIRVGGGNTYMAFPPPHHIPQKGKIEFHISPEQFNPGGYNISVSVGPHQSQLLDKIEHCISFNIQASDIYGNGYVLKQDDGCSFIHFDAKVLE